MHAGWRQLKLTWRRRRHPPSTFAQFRVLASLTQPRCPKPKQDTYRAYHEKKRGSVSKLRLFSPSFGLAGKTSPANPAERGQALHRRSEVGRLVTHHQALADAVQGAMQGVAALEARLARSRGGRLVWFGGFDGFGRGGGGWGGVWGVGWGVVGGVEAWVGPVVWGFGWALGLGR